MNAVHEQQKFAVQVGDFEGPIELLLRLIEQRKLAINDISLAHITDEYIAHIKNMPIKNYSYSTHFIYVASTLVLIKSKSLLPSLQLTEEEQESVHDLKMRLALYQIYKDQALLVKEALYKKTMYARPFSFKRAIVFSPDPVHMRLDIFPEVLLSLLGQVPQTEKLAEVRVRTALHIDELVRRLQERIQGALNVSFNEFSRAPLPDATPKEQRVYTIVSFLAVLEMARNGIINVTQEKNFSDMIIQNSN